MVLWHVPVQVSQVGVELDKSVERDPRSATLLILCQDLTGYLQRTQEGLWKMYAETQIVKKHAHKYKNLPSAFKDDHIPFEHILQIHLHARTHTS